MFKWNFIGYVFQYMLKIVFGIFLARLLSPNIFGLFAIIVALTSISEVLLNSGMKTSIIRSSNINDYELTSIFLYNIFLGVIFFVIYNLLAPIIAQFYDEKNLILCIRYFSLSFILRSFTIAFKANVERLMKYKELSIINISCSLFSSLLAVIFALKGFGIFALIFSFLFSDLLNLLMSVYWGRFNVRYVTSEIFLKSIHPHFKFGINILLSRLFEMIVSKIDVVLFARISPVAVIGLFNKGRYYGNLPSQFCSSVIFRPVIPFMSKIKTNTERVLYLNRIMRNVVVFIFPLLTFLGINCHFLILNVLGYGWIDMIPYFRITILTSFIVIFISLLKKIMLSNGDSKHILRFNLLFSGLKFCLVLLFVWQKYDSLALLLYIYLIISVFEFFSYLNKVRIFDGKILRIYIVNLLICFLIILCEIYLPAIFLNVFLIFYLTCLFWLFPSQRQIVLSFLANFKKKICIK